jgi:hypothetical protein
MVSATPIRVIMSSSAEAGQATTADAAAKLAGDVNAAAEAYENLRRLLQRQFADPPRANLESGRSFEVAPTPTALPSHASPTNLALAVRQAPMAPPSPGRWVRAAEEPRRLDIRGFLAGFAVAAAIGAALYICLAAG